MAKKVIIYLDPNYSFEEDMSLGEIRRMPEQERYIWARNVHSDLVTIYHSLEEFCERFNEELISDLGYLFVGETLI